MSRSDANPISGGYVLLPWRALRAAAARMARGLEDHERDSWRRLGEEANLDHALEHLGRYLEGDRSEDHLCHAMLRVLMAYELRETATPAPPAPV